MPLLEVCVDSWASVKAAVDGGAKRIELCSALSEGGLTPSVGFLKIIKNQYPKLTVFAMLRPHGRGDFYFSDLDMQIIVEDIRLLRENGADGFVFGALTKSKEIDQIQCQLVKDHCQNLPLTFHRAFDLTDPAKMIENAKLIATLGFSRILTSGFRQTAEEGLPSIRRLCKSIKELIILPGAGVNSGNVRRILQETGCVEIHASAKGNKQQNSSVQPDEIDFGTATATTDVNIVKHLIKEIDNVLE